MMINPLAPAKVEADDGTDCVYRYDFRKASRDFFFGPRCNDEGVTRLVKIKIKIPLDTAGCGDALELTSNHLEIEY